MTNRKLAEWLTSHGFTQVPAGRGGHANYVRNGHKVTIVHPDRGKFEMNMGYLSNFIRQLERAGFSRATIRRDLGA